MVIEKLVDICMQLLRIQFSETVAYSEENLNTVVENVRKMEYFDDETRADILEMLKTKIWIHLEKGTELVDASTFKPWLSDQRASIDFYYWKRYRKLLLEDKLWNINVVNSLDQVSDDILELIGNPNQVGSWARRGLLLGDVQSGKTSNYLSICNKAADAGFKIIILLTGTIESLRKQTQQRVDEGFTGRNSKEQLSKTPISRLVGVGNKGGLRCAIPFTSIDYDFSSSLLRQLNLGIQDLREPAIFVVKKNKTVLENLEVWLKTWCTEKNADKIDHPLLLIDDESDNASVNTSDETNPTAINRCIRDILHIFNRSTYLAVTATPFANIFINPFDDEANPDLFPKDFIYALAAPTNYIGSNEIFGDEGKYSSVVEIIDDGEDVYKLGHKKNIIISELPLSLKKSILYFCISNTIRDIRKNSTKHMSMLVNVSRYTDVQSQIYNLVLSYFYDVRDNVQNYVLLDGSEYSNNIIRDLKSVYERYFRSTSEADWEQIKLTLHESISPIKVLLVNQRSTNKSLEYNLYENGLRVIAIGGDSLSRGLTLEGLSVSYFYRNSKMYDTLMQMGRWFGYRDNYEDLFRIWLPEAGVEWYEHITDASNELREEIRYMQIANLTPNDFGLKVKNHQDSMLITARNKMKFTKEIIRPVSLNGQLLESPRLVFAEQNFSDNYRLASRLLSSINSYRKKDEGSLVYWTDIPKEIIGDFVKNFSVHPSNIKLQPGFVGEYIKSYDEYPVWDVAIPMGDGNEITIDNIKIQRAIRNVSVNGNCLSISAKHARVGSPDCAKYCLSPEQKEEAEYKYKVIKEEKKVYPSYAYLKIERKPLLILNFLQIKNDNDQYAKAEELLKRNSIVSISVGIPDVTGKNTYKTMIYVANLIEMANYENINEEEIGDDENED